MGLARSQVLPRFTRGGRGKTADEQRAAHTPEAWRQLIVEQRGSGQSQDAFCEAHGLAKSTFQAWKLHLYGRAGSRSPLCRSMMRPKVFHGANSMICANSVLPTFMCHPGSIKPASIASQRSAIQIVDTHESLETRVGIGFSAGSH